MNEQEFFSQIHESAAASLHEAGISAPSAPPTSSPLPPQGFNPPNHGPPTGRNESTISSLIGRDSFEFNGVTYRIGPIVPAIKGDFEQLCWASEARGIERIRSAIDWASYMDYRNDYLRGIVSKKWAYNGTDSQIIRQTPGGLKDLYWLMLRHYNNPMIFPPLSGTAPQVPYELIEEIWDDNTKFEELHAKMESLKDPNHSAPIQQGAS